MFWTRKPTPTEILLECLERAASNPTIWIPVQNDNSGNATNLQIKDRTIQINASGTLWRRLKDDTSASGVWHKVDLNKKEVKRVVTIYNAIIAEQATRNIEKVLEGLVQ